MKRKKAFPMAPIVDLVSVLIFSFSLCFLSLHSLDLCHSSSTSGGGSAACSGGPAGGLETESGWRLVLLQVDTA